MANSVDLDHTASEGADWSLGAACSGPHWLPRLVSPSTKSTSYLTSLRTKWFCKWNVANTLRRSFTTIIECLFSSMGPEKVNMGTQNFGHFTFRPRLRLWAWHFCLVVGNHYNIEQMHLFVKMLLDLLQHAFHLGNSLGYKLFYRKTGNFRVIQFSRNFAVSINPWKLKSAKYFPIFKTISAEELVAYMIAICRSYLFICSKTSNMQLSKNSLSLQAIWLEVNCSMAHPIYSMSHWLIFFCCCIWHTFNCFSFFIE